MAVVARPHLVLTGGENTTVNMKLALSSMNPHQMSLNLLA